MRAVIVWMVLFVGMLALPVGVATWVLAGLLLYPMLAGVYRWGIKVGRGAERHELRQQAYRDGGYLFFGIPPGEQRAAYDAWVTPPDPAECDHDAVECESVEDDSWRCVSCGATGIGRGLLR